MENIKIYIYHDGSDCMTFETHFVEWLTRDFSTDSRVRIINDKPISIEPDSAGFLPDWNIGINLSISVEAFADLEYILSCFVVYAQSLHRDFVLGYYDEAKRISEDILFISAKSQISDLMTSLKKWFYIPG